MTDEFGGADREAVTAYRDAVAALVAFQDRRGELETRLERCREFAVGHAYAAFAATLSGEAASARQRVRLVRTSPRGLSRRERQLVEILLLAVDGEDTRAAGLAVEHTREFPVDAEALTIVTRWAGTPERRFDGAL
jgi:hypothetical protein